MAEASRWWSRSCKRWSRVLRGAQQWGFRRNDAKEPTISLGLTWFKQQQWALRDLYIKPSLNNIKQTRYKQNFRGNNCLIKLTFWTYKKKVSLRTFECWFVGYRHRGSPARWEVSSTTWQEYTGIQSWKSEYMRKNLGVSQNMISQSLMFHHHPYLKGYSQGIETNHLHP